MRQNCNCAISLPTPWIVDVATESIDNVWGSPQGQFRVVSPDLIDPVHHFGCTL